MFENRENNEDELVVLGKEDKRIVYAIDERESEVTGSERIFDNEA